MQSDTRYTLRRYDQAPSHRRPSAPVKFREKRTVVFHDLESERREGDPYNFTFLIGMGEGVKLNSRSWFNPSMQQVQQITPLISKVC
jgi:hypothetical protein